LNDIRLEQLKKWLAQQPEIGTFELAPASSDASFRRYFRITCSGGESSKTYIAMDAPPEKENSEPFVIIAKILFDSGINTPEIFQADYKLGFFLISDLGSEQYLSALNAGSAENLYRPAIDTLIQLQQIPKTALATIPNYDQKLLMTEMGLFRDWYLDRHRGIKLNSEQQSVIITTFELLANSALAQKQVLVHRDYHSRNLMINNSDSSRPGILDFQDAVIGPFTYDLVSLLRDCYISWPKQQVVELALLYKQQAQESNIIPKIDNDDFIKSFDWMGIQRHLKAIGIFSRLNYRDNKSSYLSDIPRTIDYIKNISKKHQELDAFTQFLNTI